MLTRSARANAIPETALVLALALSVLYGVVQAGLIGFTQVSADGAAFVGAHTTVAKYSGPGTSDYSYTTTAAKSVFPHISATITPSVPAGGTYETDLTMQLPVVLSGLFGPYVTRARTIEPSASQANLGTGLGPCATGAIDLTGGITNGAANTTVGLLQGTVGTANTVFNIQQDVNGNTAVVLNSTTGANSVVNTHVQLLQTIETGLQALDYTNSSGQKSGLLVTITNLLQTANIGGILNGPISTLSNAIEPALADALDGVPTAQMTTDLNKITSAVSTGPLALVSGLLGDITGTNGLESYLTSIDTAAQKLLANDATAPASC